MLWQVHPRLGVSTEKLRPIDFMPRLSVPLLVIAGTGDPFTPLAESKRLFSAASGPKELWEAEGATHESICSYAPDTYKLVVLRFFDKYLPSGETPSFSVKKQEEIKTRASLASPGGKSYGEGRAQNTYLTNRKSFAKNIQ
jgi:hypothetical protein